MSARIQQLVAGLTPDEQSALRILATSAGAVHTGYLSTELRVEHPYGGHPERVISELGRRGLLIWLGDGRVQLAPGILPAVSEALGLRDTVPFDEIVRVRERPTAFYRALLLASIDAQPPRSTRARTLYKADSDRLAVLFGDACGGPDGVAAMIRLLEVHSLVQDKDGMVLPRWGRVRAWASLRPGERALLDLNDAFCRSGGYLGHVLDRLIDAASQSAGSPWVSAEALAGHHRRVRYAELSRWRAPSTDQLQSEWCEIERRLWQSGLIVQGDQRTGTLAYRLNQASVDALQRMRAAGDTPAAVQDVSRTPSEPLCHVQPTFEVIVPPEVAIADLVDLGSFTEVVSLQTVATLRLTAHRVRTAAGRGASAAEMLGTLNRVARHGVPPAVAHQVGDWAGGASRVELIQALMLRVDPVRAAELKLDAKLSRYLLAELAPGLFAIDPVDQRALVKALTGRGLPAAPQVVRYPREDAASPVEGESLAQELAAAVHLVGWRSRR